MTSAVYPPTPSPGRTLERCAARFLGSRKPIPPHGWRISESRLTPSVIWASLAAP